MTFKTNPMKLRDEHEAEMARLFDEALKAAKRKLEERK